MRIAQYCLEKADIMERRKQGFKMQGERAGFIFW